MGAHSFTSPEQMREVLGRLLAEIDADPAAGSQLGSLRLPQRFVFPDTGVTLDVGPAGEGDGDHFLRWSFDGEGEPTPSLTLEMDSDVANSYLQGRENLAIAIARRRIKASCNARAALAFLPVSGALISRYTSIIEDSYPALVEA